MTNWNKAQEWERQWHNDCCNSLNEELKQLVYAKRMGLKIYQNEYTSYNLKHSGRILDIGGGAYSLLLKTINPQGCVVVDPCRYPEWVEQRYASKKIENFRIKGEDVYDSILRHFDEVWIYNCLQHTDNPEKIIDNAKRMGTIVRIFEWIETGTNEGHIHNLTKEKLDKWLGGHGQIEQLSEQGCYGLAYYGIFKGNEYV